MSRLDLAAPPVPPDTPEMISVPHVPMRVRSDGVDGLFTESLEQPLVLHGERWTLRGLLLALSAEARPTYLADNRPTYLAEGSALLEKDGLRREISLLMLETDTRRALAELVLSLPHTSIATHLATALKRAMGKSPRAHRWYHIAFSGLDILADPALWRSLAESSDRRTELFDFLATDPMSREARAVRARLATVVAPLPQGGHARLAAEATCAEAALYVQHHLDPSAVLPRIVPRLFPDGDPPCPA